MNSTAVNGADSTSGAINGATARGKGFLQLQTRAPFGSSVTIKLPCQQTFSKGPTQGAFFSKKRKKERKKERKRKETKRKYLSVVFL